MTSTEFIKKLQDVVGNYKTAYMWGVFGSQVTESIIADKTKQYPSWYTSARQSHLRSLIGKGYWAFDCVCLIKAILWGWIGDTSQSRGGAVYASNSVPDLSADGMIAKCSGVSTDFTTIIPGEAVWMSGHIGVYIGDGKVIECTPSWTNDVQVTACLNIGAISGLNGRKWTKHGKLPYITYEDATSTSQSATGGTTEFPAWTCYLRRTTPMMTGDDIKAMQTALNNKGFSCGTADGVFGDKTLAAVKAFQKNKGLTVDGIVGPITYAALGA